MVGTVGARGKEGSGNWGKSYLGEKGKLCGTDLGRARGGGGG